MLSAASKMSLVLKNIWFDIGGLFSRDVIKTLSPKAIKPHVSRVKTIKMKGFKSPFPFIASPLYTFTYSQTLTRTEMRRDVFLGWFGSVWRQIVSSNPNIFDNS